MATIYIYGGFTAQVDDEDYQRVAQHTWSRSSKGYAKTRLGHMNVMLHRFVLDIPNHDPRIIDHINGNRMDCRKTNLRIADYQTNAANRRKISGKSSSYKGVTYREKLNRWEAQIKVNQKTKFLGNFDNEIDAAKAYNEAARRYFGEYALLNIID